MNKVDTITGIMSRTLDKYRNSIPRKAFVDAMELVIASVIEQPDVREGKPVPGIQLVKSPYTTVGELAELLCDSCPPFRTAGTPDCIGVSCRDCWAAWLSTGIPVRNDRKE